MKKRNGKNLFDRFHISSGLRRNLMRILACFVVFTTTYALILPAITLDVRSAKKEPGIGIAAEVEAASEMQGTDPASEESEPEPEPASAPAEEEPASSEDQNQDTPAEAPADIPAETETPQETTESSESFKLDSSDDTEASSVENGSTEYADPLEIENADTETAPEDTDNIEDEVSVDYPAQEFSESLDDITTDEKDDKLLIKVEADEGAFPEGTTMTVQFVTKKIDLKNIEEAVKTALDEKTKENQSEDIFVTDKNIVSYQALDITFADKDGKEIEPLKGIRVTVTSDQIAVKDQETMIVHIDDEGKGEVVEPAKNEDLEIEPEKDQVVFNTDSFSVYVIVYTVDFHWEVNGKMFEFRIPGGGFASMQKLVEMLGIAGGSGSEYSDVPEADVPVLENIVVSEAAREFVAEISSVEFSSPELLSVSKVEENTTVGAIRDGLGLVCEYSADLTEEQIEEINAQTVEAGDWALISLKPFTTSEKLTVTLKSGEVFAIWITDAQISEDILTALGETYRITVTFDDDAQIPAGTKLKVREIEPGEDDYLQLLGRTWLKVNKEYKEQEKRKDQENLPEEAEIIRPVNIDDARFFDISFEYEGLTLEPEAPVNVDIRLINGLNNIADDPVTGVVHFPDTDAAWAEEYDADLDMWEERSINDNPVELIENVQTMMDENGAFVGFAYEQESFSEVGVYIGQTTEEVGIEPIDPAVALPKLAAMQFRAGETPQLAPFEASKVLTPNKTESGERDGTYTLSLSVKGDAVETKQITKANVLIVMDRSTSMRETVTGGIPFDGPYQQGGTYYGIVNNELVTLNYNSSTGQMTYTSEDSETVVYEGTVYVSSSRLQAEQAALDELVAMLVSKNNTDVPGEEDIIEVFVASFASERGKNLPGQNTGYSGTTQGHPQFSEGTESGWQTTYNNNDDLYNAVHNSSINNGTNWEDALLYAKELADDKKRLQPDEDVFVIFMTDGIPTAIHGESSNLTAGWGAFHYDNTLGGSGYAYNFARDGSVYTDYSNLDPNYSSTIIANRADAIAYPSQAIVNAGHKFYGIFTFNPEEEQVGYLRRLVNFAYGNGDVPTYNPTLDSFYTDARDIAALRQSFDNIFTSIFDSLAYGDVKVVDGLSTDSMTAVLHDGQADDLKYTVKDENGNLVYTVTASGDQNDPDDVVFTIGNNNYMLSEGQVQAVNVTRTRTEFIDGEPVQVEYSAGTYYSVKVGGIEYRMALADLVSEGTGLDQTRTLTWDLSPIGSLKKDYTYTVEFIVWPNQEAYDYVAGLNNHLDGFVWYDEPVYDDETGEVIHPGATAVYDEDDNFLYYKGGVTQYPSIVKDANGIYSVLTNTEQKVYYSEVHTSGSNDVVTSEETTPHEETLETPPPMPLVSTETELEKTWSVDRNPAALAQFLYDSQGNSKEFVIDYGIYRDGDGEEQLYTTAQLGWDGTKYVWDPDSVREVRLPSGVRRPVGMKWTQGFAIAAGLMLSEEEMLKLGLDITDPAYDHFDYVTEQGTTTYYLLEDGHDYTIKEIIPEEEESWVTYEFDFVAPVYHPMLVDGKLKSVVFDKEDGAITGIKEISKDDWMVSLKMENVLRGYLNIEKRIVDTDGVTALPDDDTKFTYIIELDNEADPGPFVEDSIPWYGVNGLFYHTYDEQTESYTYYQAEVTNTENNKSHTLTIETETGEVYEAWCTNEDGTGIDDETLIFDEDVPGPTWVTYQKGEDEFITIKLFGNQMTCLKEEIEVETEGGETETQIVDSTNHIYAEFQISQTQTLYLANIPQGTTYRITEEPEAGYSLVNVRKEIRNGEVVESRTMLPAGAVEGEIVPDRDNHFIFTNKIYTNEITVKKVDEDWTTPLPGAVFTLTRTSGEGSSDYDNGVSVPAAGETDLGSYSFTDLPNGTYTLTETTPPDGYTGLTGSVTFTVTNGVISVPSNLPNDSVRWDGETLTFTVRNQSENTPGKVTVRKQWLDSEGNLTSPGEQDISVILKRKVDTPSTNTLTIVVNANISVQGNITRTWQIPITNTAYRISWADNGEFQWVANRLRHTDVSGVSIQDGIGSNNHGDPNQHGNNMNAIWNISNLQNVTQDITIVFTYQSGYNGDRFLNDNLPFYNALRNATLNATPTGSPIQIGTGEPVEDTGFSQTIHLNNANRWSETISNLPTQDGSGNKYHYYIEEEELEGYTVTYSDNDEEDEIGVNSGVLTVTNQKTERGSLSVKKLLQASNSAISDGNMTRANGKYNFTVSRVTSEELYTTEIIKYVQIRIKNGAVTYKAAFTEAELEIDTGYKWAYAEGALVEDLIPGTYVVEETGYELDVPDGYSTELVQLEVGGDESNTADLPGRKATVIVTEGDVPSAASTFTNLLIPVVDVPVNKSWTWSEEDEDRVHHWTAVFNLEYREVLVSGEEASDAKTRWTPVYKADGETQESVTISSDTDQSTDVFEDLPMYKVHENGSVYRLIYAVDEVSYTLYGENNQVIKTWDKSQSGHLDQHYSPTYEQDAGELDQPSDLDDWVDWYTIKVSNNESTKETVKTVDLSIHKTWENDEEQIIAADPASYAKFQLKRYVHEESLDLTNNGLDDPDIPLVTVQLVQGSSTISELVVPKGAPVYVTGVVRPEQTINLTFSNGIVLNGGSGASTKQQYIVSGSSFTANADTDITLTVGDTSALVGGINGLRLASFDQGDITEYDEDESFSNQAAGKVFTLNNENEWQKSWLDLPQIVEERTVGNDGHTILKTIVYSYYLEEIENYPVNFKPEFQNDLGNSDNPVISDTPVAVENKLKTIDLTGKKIWKNIEGDITENPILKLTRTTLVTTGEGDDAVTEEIDPVVISEMQGDVSVTLQPKWSDEDGTLTYTYSGLPEMDQDGNLYHYYVSETTFTVGTGENAVTYTVVKETDGSYTVTANKAGAEEFSVTQDENDITNELLRTTIVIRKIDEATRDEASQTMIDGASFQLLKHDGSTYTIYNEEYSDEEGVDVNSDGTLSFEGLPNGEYKIVEVKIPAGYTKQTNNDIYFQINNGVVTRYDKPYGDDSRAVIPTTIMQEEESVSNVVAAISYTTEKYEAVFTVGNIPGAALPHTGGPGTWIFTILGVLMISIAGVGLVQKKRGYF